MFKYIPALFIIVLVSCSEKKEIKMTSFNLTERKINVCFNQDMKGYEVNFIFTKNDNTKITNNENMFFAGHSFYDSDTCFDKDKTNWNDRFATEAGNKYWSDLKTNDFKEIKFIVLEHLFDTVATGVYIIKR